MSHDVPPRAVTIRQAIRAALEREPLTAHDLSAETGIPERDVASHLEHLERACRGRGEAFVVLPARCEACGFVFKKRDRLTAPGRCPVCRSERISNPRFSMAR